MATITGTNPAARPTPSTFVTRSGSQLLLDGKQYRAVGPNIYWLGLDENVYQYPSYPTPSRILDIMATVNAMGANTIRSQTLGISVGNKRSFETALGVFNSTALDYIDYAIYAARLYGIRVIIPLTDNYDYYHGGKFTFLKWRNLSNADDFYTNTDVRQDFKDYIGSLVNHTSKYTNVTMANDPAILAWETGNELNDPPVEWTKDISEYIKSIAPQQLVVDGNYGINKDALNLNSIDIASNHYYPPTVMKLKSNIKAVHSANKVFIAGEYDANDHWTAIALIIAAFIPVIPALITLFLPRRWFPIRIPCPCFSRSRKAGKRYQRANSEFDVSPAEDKLDYPPTLSPGGISPQSSAPSPQSPSAHLLPSGSATTKPTLRIKKWYLVVFWLLMVPFAVLIAYEVGPSRLSRFFSTIESENVGGSFYWSLFGQNDNCTGFVQHNDGFTMHYPGDNSGMKQRIVDLTGHAYRMSGQQPIGFNSVKGLTNSMLPSITCPQNVQNGP